VEGYEGLCVVAFVPSDDKYWVVGDPFYRNYYVMHDYDSGKTGVVGHIYGSASYFVTEGAFTEQHEESGPAPLEWWAWLLIAIGAVLLIGGIVWLTIFLV